jgi:histidine phosphotransferase ChpT
MLALLAEAKGGTLQYKLADKTLVMGAILPQPEGMIG